MNKTVISLSLLLLALLVSGRPSTLNQPTPLALIHVTVIDATGAPPKPGMTVVITGDRISALGKDGNVRLPERTQVIDASGKYLIPGLWDMHVHSMSYENGKRLLPTLLARGITGVRDMGSPLEDVIRLRRETGEGKIAGAWMVAAGPLLQGPLPFQLPFITSVHDTFEASRTVVDLKGRGADFIKVQDALPRDLYFAIAAEAKKQNIRFAGHTPPSVSAMEATNAGQHSIEHLGGRFYGVLLSCSSREAELSARIRGIVNDALRALKEKREPDDSEIFRASFTRPLLDSFDERKAAKLFSVFKKNGTWQVPTLVAQPLREALNGGRADLNADDIRYGKRLLEKQFEVVLAMQRAGVKIMAGTDRPPDGLTLHNELALLVGAGLSPLEALQSATRNPAEFLGRLDALGTVERGKIADLVLLDANPLEDIRNTLKIHTVIVGGKLVETSTSPTNFRTLFSLVRRGRRGV
jgi:imidazolonepropionase-like amidohydrolase